MEQSEVKYIVSENMKKVINNDPEEPNTEWFYISTNHEPFKDGRPDPKWNNEDLKDALIALAFPCIKEIVLATISSVYTVVQIRGDRQEIINEMNQ